MRKRVTIEELEKEARLTASVSGGPGGQNVNKVNTKVTLRLDIKSSPFLTEEEKELVTDKLASRMTKEGELVLSAQEERSQLKNKTAVLKKAEFLLTKALAKKKPRKATKPSKGAMESRLQLKKQHAQKKKWRQKPL